MLFYETASFHPEASDRCPDRSLAPTSAIFSTGLILDLIYNYYSLVSVDLGLGTVQFLWPYQKNTKPKPKTEGTHMQELKESTCK